jgi:hypothetical protein
VAAEDLDVGVVPFNADARNPWEGHRRGATNGRAPPSPLLGHPRDGASISGQAWNPSGTEIMEVMEPQWQR